MRLTHSSMPSSIKWLQPYLYTRTTQSCCATSSSYLRFYNAIRSYSTEQSSSISPQIQKVDRARIRMVHGEEEPKYAPDPYPRITNNEGVVTYTELRDHYHDVNKSETLKAEATIRGTCSYYAWACRWSLMTERKDMVLSYSWSQACVHPPIPEG